MASVNKFALIARNLSTTSSASQMVKPPVQVFGTEGRYATALYSAATKMKQLDQVEKDLKSLQATMKSDAKLRDMIVSPIINRKVMANALKDTTKQLRMSEATSNLLQTMADNGRLKRLDGIINSFNTIMAAHRGEVVCEVVTAKPLDDSQRKQLEGALKKFLKGNQSLQLSARVDPSLIGGMVVSIGDKYIDMSIASKVKLYTDLISQTA
ncbi:ATP synthase subunit O, mitochondrial [Condylostylus longicornis]|uniref:ATP synthase subunit O, mitochondrial n=1 Tax=Condylostylus longicornis TaxID=2530218 RepID=UPI00244DC5E4|nr:ATP synthase subunit O, mitochondrial [Condylostylus longicornis]